jgi:hypothetical protein
MPDLLCIAISVYCSEVAEQQVVKVRYVVRFLNVFLNMLARLIAAEQGGMGKRTTTSEVIPTRVMYCAFENTL